MATAATFSKAEVFEGEQIKLYFYSLGIDPSYGTLPIPIYWSISGTGITDSDFKITGSRLDYNDPRPGIYFNEEELKGLTGYTHLNNDGTIRCYDAGETFSAETLHALDAPTKGPWSSDYKYIPFEISYESRFLEEGTEILELKTFSDAARTQQVGSTSYLTIKEPTGSIPTNISCSSYRFIEKIPSGSVVAILSTSDLSSNDSHTYSLVTGDGDDDNTSFSIDGNKLVINHSPLYSTKNSYSIRVQTVDSTGNVFTKSIDLNASILREKLEFNEGDGTHYYGPDVDSNYYLDGGDGIDTLWINTSIFRSFSDFSFVKISDNTFAIQDNYFSKLDGLTTGTQYLYAGIFKNFEKIAYWEPDERVGWVDVSKLFDTKTYPGSFRDYKFYRRENGNGPANDKFEIKTDSGFDDITGIGTLEFADKSISAIVDVGITFDQVTGLNTDSGKMFRLYNAAFARFPDSDGLRYWIDKFSSGENDERVVASSFLASTEFKQTYGENISNAKYVETLYTNVLGRNYDQSGYNYWLGNLNSGAETRYELLLGFAESVENKAIFTDMTGFA